MSRWTPERVKKAGLEKFTRAKFEYAIARLMAQAQEPTGTLDDNAISLMSVKESVDMLMDITHNYAEYKIIKLVDRGKIQQETLFHSDKTSGDKS